MTRQARLAELLETLTALSDTFERAQAGSVRAEDTTELAERMRLYARLAGYQANGLSAELPALHELREHLRAIVALLGRALEMRPVVDEQAIAAAGEHMAYVVALVRALRRLPG